MIIFDKELGKILYKSLKAILINFVNFYKISLIPEYYETFFNMLNNSMG